MLVKPAYAQASLFALLAWLALSVCNVAVGQSAASAAIDVSYVGPDDVAAIAIRPHHIAQMPAMADLMKNMFGTSMGIDPSDVEQVMLVVPLPLPEKLSPNGHAVYMPVIMALFTHPVDAKSVFLKLRKSRTGAETVLQEKTIGGKSCYGVPTPNRLGNGPDEIFYSPNAKTIIYGSEPFIKKVIATEATGQPKGPLVERLQKADAESCIVGAFALDNFPGLAELIDEAKHGGPTIMATYLDALKNLHGGLATFSLKRDPLLSATLDAKSAEAADDVSNLLEQLTALASAGMAVAKGQLNAEQRKTFSGELKLLDNLIANAAAKKDGSNVDFTVKRPANVELALPHAIDSLQKAVDNARAAARRMQKMNNFKQVALAMSMFQDSQGHFPPAAITKDGKPMLSWRVAILPYIEENELYKQFHQDEPWDSPHNLPLAKKMPNIFRSLEHSDDGKTCVMVFTGKDTVFDGDKGVALSEITDGSSYTLLAVEAGPDKAVTWTKPEDIPFDPKKPLEAMGHIPADGFIAAMCDGSVHQLKLDNAKLKLFAKRNSGEVKTFDR